MDKIIFRYGEGCEHPFYSTSAYAIEGTEPDAEGKVEFKIHVRCLNCGKEMLMLSKGHVGSDEEREELGALK